MDRRIRERIHDPYKHRRKPAEPSVCPECGAVFQTGRWLWIDSPPDEAARKTCPACLRIRDDYPAGELTLAGAFVATHRDEMVRLVRNQEELEKTEHPLHRIMDIKEGSELLTIRTTDLHLPRRLARALARAFNGKAKVHYNKEACFIRIDWRRES